MVSGISKPNLRPNQPTHMSFQSGDACHMINPQNLQCCWWLIYMCCDATDMPDYVTIYKAITILNSMTCVRFVPWNGRDKDHLIIWPVKQPKGYVIYNGGNHDSGEVRMSTNNTRDNGRD